MNEVQNFSTFFYFQLMNERAECVISITASHKKKMLKHDLTMLLETRDQLQIPVYSLLSAYYRFFGCKLYHRNYGYANLYGLIENIGKEIKVSLDCNLHLHDLNIICNPPQL